jgi:predicted aminopeptidase
MSAAVAVAVAVRLAMSARDRKRLRVMASRPRVERRKRGGQATIITKCRFRFRNLRNQKFLNAD